MKKIILTGDRPTGRLHLGHYVGSLQKRVEIQNSGDFDELFVMIADSQALTDNFENPQKVRENILSVALDYLSVGLDPNKTVMFIQSMVSELCELTYYYLNFVTVSRLQRNPTVKNEIKLRGFEKSVPAGFLAYPISQAADITAFDATIVPVGEDQMPVIEQTREIVRSINNLFGDVLVEPKGVLNDKKHAARLPGIDGNEKMGKSLGNAIYLSDSEEEIKAKVMKMYTDPDHIRVEDPGKVEGNMVFLYLDVFGNDEQIARLAPEYKCLQDVKDHYARGGLGDVKVKKLLISVLNEFLAPIREKRAYYQSREKEVFDILMQGTKIARAKAAKTLQRLKKALCIDFE